VFTVPNLISLVRLACVPLFVWLLFGRDEPYAAAWLLGAIGATDWVDGYVARHFNQVSTLGKVLDPVADRIMLGVAIVSILLYEAAPWWVGVSVLAREGLVSIAVLVLGAMGARRIDVSWVGKAGTFLLMWAFPFFLASAADYISWADTARVIAWIFAIPGMVLSWWAALMYVPVAKRALAEGRRGAAT